ncbi:16S rRNA (guanine(527)-N(7))-methyltransferase RsmG [Pedococcus bigeumensis]|uniref:Ribosomal RNA small subunit methyltransferase G n=1 Tax=Pedococcus bigeumensis TaxID=433644 RepID=A0A502CW12_9MICO|nr:16S rRNA (guanine(527)-N(7))-methyltransferase RsmG [Pedococcus bigeumensis]TPG17108.1 16S rRNA (guanine(527)-N(7))-methyltransferase RsmG [Pedococcus bigeumensis]
MTGIEPSDDGRGTGETGTAPVVASGGSADGTDGPAVAPVAPSTAAAVFGPRLELAERFAAILADTGVSHGLIGPREVPILWDRHILNCAVAHEAFPAGATVVDVGSGAGLPGLAMAIARPDLQLHLVEPMLRRTTWLSATIDELGLDNCTVHRGRAEEFDGVLSAPFATARAVARIDKLARWTFPLLADGGTLVALKGGSAAEELAAEEKVLRKLGMTASRVVTYGAELLPVATTTLQLTVGARPLSRAAKRRAKNRS